MKRDRREGRHPFVVVEGGDGAGKTSVRQHLFARLREHGVVALSTIPVSWLVPAATEVITKAKYLGYAFPPERIVRAYVRDKEELTARILDPHLPWRPAICDRFVMSDVVYNEIVFGIARDDMAAAYRASAVREPDLVVFIDTPPEVAVERLRRRAHGQGHPWEALEPQRRVAAGFQAVLAQNPMALAAEVIRIDNAGDLARTLERVDALVLPRLLAAADTPHALPASRAPAPRGES
ncbi:MAG TPA: hypothetical protein VFX28_20135 [Methylomirabilota bacterium]|nr:hypothetical protein [Methylomirabilota bacterium]